MHSIQRRRYMANSDNILLCLYRRIKYMVHICSAQCARQAICAHIHIIIFIFACRSYSFTCSLAMPCLGLRFEQRNVTIFLCSYFVSFSFSRLWIGFFSMRVICVLFWQSNTFRTVFILAIVRSTFVAYVKSIASHSVFLLLFPFHFLFFSSNKNFYEIRTFKRIIMYQVTEYQTIQTEKYG